MLKIENHIGKITISKKYIVQLVESTVTRCFGVADVCSTNTFHAAVSAITGRSLEKYKGVNVYTDKNGGLAVDLHIKVTYGTNISAIVASIVHKVGYTIEEAVGVAVSNINVYVDDMNS